MRRLRRSLPEKRDAKTLCAREGINEKDWIVHVPPALGADGRMDESGEMMKRMIETLALTVAVSMLAMMLLTPKSAAQNNQSQTPPRPLRPVHTFSIVARDPETGELGVAVQSHWFSVGAIVPWAEAGIGAVATQSFVDPSYGKLGLDLMRVGRSAPDALKALLAGDEGREVRQVAMIDAQGRVDAWTGKNCIQSAGNIVGKNYSAQANLMANDKVWPAMSRAFETTKGDLAERMLAALDAAQGAGGDIRGRQSAALIVVSGKPTGKPWADRVFDLRVDDSPEPLKELRRLVTLQRAYNHMNAGDLAVEKKDNEGALREYGAAEKLVPDNAEMIYWHAVALVNMGRVEESLPLFRRVFTMDKNWVELTPRLAKVGLLPDDAKVIERILRESK
ncbi:MAG: hypothetical protein QOH63_1159 [Acidobacteriota bacterium]|jgi:uncharacterized Ntn-hydrolase superfamily protein|nr:hypothetical protein [Acidobacteriota bacterium]